MPPKNTPAKAAPVTGAETTQPAAEAASPQPAAEAAEQQPGHNGDAPPAGQAADRAAAGEDTAANETTTDETAADETAAGETATDETAAGETATDETATDETTAGETATDAEEAAGTPAATSAEAPAAAPAGAPAQRRGLRVPALLAVVIVMLGGFGVWATVQANSLRASNAGQNVALTDVAATSSVRHQVSSAVNQIFSYRYTDTAATRRAAQNVLTGRAIRQYDQLFSLVEKQAPVQKLVVTTTVTNSGVQFLSGDRARVLIYANQQSTRAGTSQSTYAGAMFAVTAVRAGGRWKIENIDTFTGS